MKSLRKVLYLLICLTLIFVTGCSADSSSKELNSESRWYYTKDQSSSFIEANGMVTKTEADGLLQISFNASTFTLNGELEEDNVKVINASKVLANTSSSYMSYKAFKNYTCEIESIKTLNGNSVNIQFYGDIYSDYLVLVHKDAVNEENFVFVNLEFINTAQVINKPIQLEFESDFIETGVSWTDIKSGINIIGGIAQIIIGCYCSPNAIASGVTTIVTSLGDLFAADSGPSLADIMEKLDIMDAKLDEVMAKMDANQAQLLDEMLRIDAKVDKNILTTLEQNRTAFYTDYVRKLDNFKRDFSDVIAQELKQYVKSEHTIDLYYVIDEDGTLRLLSACEDTEGATKYSITISEFAQSKQNLKDNNNMVKNGFMDDFRYDIMNVVKWMGASDKPVDLSYSEFCDDVVNAVIDGITVKYYQDNHDEARALLNDAIAYLNRIAGIGSKSIVDDYYDRAKIMYNFAGEAREVVIDTLSSMLYEVERIGALAAAACLYAEINDDDLLAAYKAAVTKITNTYNIDKEYPDNYCYETETCISANFYKAIYDVGYTDIGNFPHFNSKLTLSKVTKEYNWTIQYTEDSFNDHLNQVTEADMLRIKTRYQILIKAGLIKQMSLLDYLHDNKAIAENAYVAYKALLSNGYVSTDACRFALNFEIKDMHNHSEYKNQRCYCMAQGSPGGSYFYTGKAYKFMGSYESDCWDGKFVSGTIVNGLTGELTYGQKVCLYATYHEAHAWWMFDEYWAFVDNEVGNYFFIMENVPSIK